MTLYTPAPIQPDVMSRARELRSVQSKSETFLWDRLRGRRLNGVKFRRQFPMPPYTIDFYARAERVAVELDGELHEQTKEVDALRDETLRRWGIVTVRVTTAELFGNTHATLEKIWSVVSGR